MHRYLNFRRRAWRLTIPGINPFPNPAAVTPAGDQLNVITATNGQKVFRAGTDANGPLYGVASGNIKISVGYVTSAIARPANNKVELAFPFDTNSGGLATASWSTASACNDIVEVLALGVEGSPRAVASCALANNVLTVTLAAEEPYAPGTWARVRPFCVPSFLSSPARPYELQLRFTVAAVYHA